MPPAKKKEEPKKSGAKHKEEPKPAPKVEAAKPAPPPPPPPAPEPVKPATPQDTGKPWVLEVAKPLPPPPRTEPEAVNACAKCGKKVGAYETVDSATGKGFCSLLCYSKRNG